MFEALEPTRALLGERLVPAERLTKSADFARCYKTGRRRHGPLVTLHYTPNDRGRPRLGITASRKVGKAVLRHRLKRRIREIYRRWDDKWLLPPLDLVFHLKPAAASSEFSGLRREVLRLLEPLCAPPGEDRSRHAPS